MNVRCTFALVVGFLLLLGAAAPAQDGLTVTKEILARIPGLPENHLLGVRTDGKSALVADSTGEVRAVSLATGEVVPVPGPGRAIIDFALRLGQPIYLTAEGRLAGQVAPNWPVTPFSACSLESAEDGSLFLSGGPDAYFLLPNATAPFPLRGLHLGLPAKDGFLWTLARHKTLRTWQAELLDCLGNRMKRICRFSREFQPEGITFGPPGPEGELLISYFSERKRFLALVGQNGRMLWRLPAPEPICRHDLGWGPDGDLLVLEKVDGTICLRRWLFAAPEG